MPLAPFIPPTPPSTDDAASRIPAGLFTELCAVVHAHCGIVLKDGKQDLVRARVAKLVRDNGHPDVAGYLRHVLATPGSPDFHRLVDALSTNLTSFFRENRHFEHLRRDHLPALIRRKLAARAPLRLRCWSAGCSTGEEPYSLAATLLETLGDAASTWDVKVLATDLSSRVLATAAKGRYDRTRLESVPPPTRQRFFRDEGRSHAHVSEELRSRVIFNYLNLLEPWPFSGPFDAVFCRNVMIYFDHPTQEKLVNRFYDVLAPGGVFFTGHSESLAGIRHRFRYVEPTIYLRP